MPQRPLHHISNFSRDKPQSCLCLLEAPGPAPPLSELLKVPHMCFRLMFCYNHCYSHIVLLDSCDVQSINYGFLSPSISLQAPFFSQLRNCCDTYKYDPGHLAFLTSNAASLKRITVVNPVQHWQRPEQLLEHHHSHLYWVSVPSSIPLCSSHLSISPIISRTLH